MKKVILGFGLLVLVSCSDSVNENAIKGANPYDMIMGLEEQGFSKEMTSNEMGVSFVMSHKSEGIEQLYSTLSEDNKTVETVRATVQIEPNVKNIEVGKSFIQYASTIPYDTMNKEAIASWVDRNYNNDKRDTIIGDVKFTMYAPSALVRMLDIEKNK